MERLTDEEVERQIEELSNSDYVRLSKKEMRQKYKRRQLLYTLRWHEKHGKELAEAGITEEMLDED